MVSRDTAVHSSAVLVGVATFLFAQLLFDLGESPQLSAAVALLWNGLVLAGAHLYLAVRGEDGMVSVEARWRYVAVVAVVLGAAALALSGQGTTVGPVGLTAVGGGVGLVAVVVYVVAEARSGYESSRPD